MQKGASEHTAGPAPTVRRRVALAALLVGAALTGRWAWRAWGAPDLAAVDGSGRDFGNFRAIYADPSLRTEFIKFLSNVFHLYPEQDLDALIAECVRRDPRDPAVYKQLEARLPEISPTLGALRYALPALSKQKAEMAAQTAQLLGEGARFDGYLEIGSHGRYLDALRERLDIRGAVFTTAPRPPTHSPEDVVDRGSLGFSGIVLPWTDYAPLEPAQVRPGSLQLVSIYIGLHHATVPARAAYVRSLHRALAPGGKLVIRDHDVVSPALDHLVGLAHDVFNAGTEESWAYNEAERRNFYPLTTLVSLLEGEGFRTEPERLLQSGDPTRNTLLCFTKV